MGRVPRSARRKRGVWVPPRWTIAGRRAPALYASRRWAPVFAVVDQAERTSSTFFHPANPPAGSPRSRRRRPGRGEDAVARVGRCPLHSRVFGGLASPSPSSPASSLHLSSSGNPGNPRQQRRLCAVEAVSASALLPSSRPSPRTFRCTPVAVRRDRYSPRGLDQTVRLLRHGQDSRGPPLSWAISFAGKQPRFRRRPSRPGRTCWRTRVQAIRSSDPVKIDLGGKAQFAAR